MDVQNLSDIELMKLAQGTPEASSQPSGLSHLSDDEVLKMAQQSPEQQADQEQAHEQSLQSEFGTPTQQALAGLEAAGRSTTFGLSTGLETRLGVNPEDIENRKEANPITSVVGDVVGLMSPVGVEGKLLTKAGEHVAERVVGDGILAGIKRGAVKLAAENALYQVGDENSKMLANDPHQSVQSALVNVGLAGAIGGGLGGLAGSVKPLWKATVGEKVAQLAADFKGRYLEHLENPEPVDRLAKEMSEYHQSIKSVADEVYGPQGLKAQEISKLLPVEMNSKIMQSTEDIGKLTEDAMKEMHKQQVPERYMNKYIQEVNRYNEVITKPEVTPGEIFNATQELKQTLQGYSKGNFGPFAIPSYHEAYDFLKITKEVAHDLRTGLEDPGVWGKAAERQQSINKAFSEYLPSLKDFEKKFTIEDANGERIIDPGKIATYLKQVGKPNAEIKQGMLQSFLDASERYKSVISDTHTNLGIETPIKQSSQSAMRGTLRELTPGAKLADLVVSKSPSLAGKSLSGAIGAAAGHMTGVPGAEWVAGLLGEKVLSPMFSSIIPVIAKAMLEKDASGPGLKAAMDYSTSVLKGVKTSQDAIKNLFKSGTKVLPDTLMPDDTTRKKTEKSLAALKIDPSKLVGVGGDIGHYMPDHQVALASTLQNITSFLNTIKPSNPPKAPLDPEMPVSKAVQSQYNRALDIAQQPLIVLESVKDGTINSNDIKGLQVMYPSLYQSLRSTVMSELVNRVSKEDVIPYKTRLGLSMFLGQPLDSSFTAESIAMAQPESPQGTAQSINKGSNQAQDKSLTQGAASTMAKGAKTSRTPGQASEAMHTTGDA